jgi:FAD/FMN-containing dehydrogenase
VDPDRIAQVLARLPDGLDVVGRDHPDFDTARRVWNGLFDKRPAAVVRSRTTADVQATVRFAREHEVLLAVRGGGHSLPGLSTCDDGIVLDLSPMRAVVVDQAVCRATVEGGALLGDLDRAGEPFGLTTPAGVVGHTGVAGLTLGGGMGRLSRRSGLTIDSLEGAELVLADGRVLEVGPDTEPELFWGIRGGGGNFGVVTSFRFRMHELGEVIVGESAYPVAQAADVLDRYARLAAAAPRELATSFVLGPTGLAISIMRSGPSRSDTAGIEAFGQLGDPTSASVGPMGFVELQAAGDELMRWGQRVYSKGGFLADLDAAAIAAMTADLEAAPVPDAHVYVIQLGGAVGDVEESATAYTGRAAGYFWLVDAYWEDPALDAACLAWARAHAARLTAVSMAGNYVNEQGDAGIAPSSYGAETFARLTALKTAVDPTNLFRLNQNIAPSGASHP